MSLRYNFARISRLRQHDHALYLDRINPITNEWAVDVEKVVQEAGRMFGR
jgi:replication fork clamp-binding protein CrfC